MKKRIFVFLAAFVVLTVSLAGCSTSLFGIDSINNDAKDRGFLYDVMYVNPGTGHITKYANASQKVIFEEEYTSKDIAIKARQAMVSDSILPTVELNGSVDIEGNSYPVVTQLSIMQRPINSDQFFSYFNEIVPPNTIISTVATDNLPAQYIFLKGSLYNDIKGTVFESIGFRITQAVESGELPKVQYELNGVSSVYRNTDIAQAAASYMPPRTAYEKFHGKTDGGGYQYKYNCATYQATTDSTDLMASLQTMFPGFADSFYIDRGSAEIKVNTTAACDVVQDN